MHFFGLSRAKCKFFEKNVKKLFYAKMCSLCKRFNSGLPFRLLFFFIYPVCAAKIRYDGIGSPI
jgi:hypothetical protein